MREAEINVHGAMIIILSLFFTVIFILLSFEYTSLIFFLSGFMLLGFISCFYFSSGKVKELKSLFFIFSSSSLVYFSYSIFSFIDFSNQNRFFIFPDQNHFYEVGDSLKNLPSLKHIFENTIISKVNIENEGMHLLTGSIAYLMNKYFDGNNILSQSLIVSGFAVFINIFIYKTLRFYVDMNTAFKYSLIFAFSSVVFAYSPWILRDIHILFFFTLGFYLTHKKFNIRTLLLLFFLQIIVSEFRFASGVAFIFFPIFYIYTKAKDYKYKGILYFLLAIILVPLLYKAYGIILDSFFTVSGRLERYVEFTAESVESSGGLARSIYQLPSGLKEFFIVILSQIQPFPPWAGIEKAGTLFETIAIIIFGISGVFWFYIIYSSLISFVKNYSQVPKSLVIALIFFCIFLFSNSSNMNVRRVMAVYPIAYIFFVYSQVYFNSRQTNIYISISFFIIYFFLLVFYILLI